MNLANLPGGVVLPGVKDFDDKADVPEKKTHV